jgi:hypothetical protein
MRLGSALFPAFILSVLQLQPVAADIITNVKLESPVAAVPGPIVGAGLPGPDPRRARHARFGPAPSQ